MGTTKRDDYFADGWAVGTGYLALHRQGTDATGLYWLGTFAHPCGLFSIYQQSGLTRIDFVKDGRCYSRTWEREWGHRTIPGLCRDFYRDLREQGIAND